MKEWLAGLDPQERLLVYGVAAVLGVLLLYVVLVHPFHSSYDKLRDSVEERRATLQWMQESALTVKQLKGANPVAGKGMGGRSLLSVTDDAARAAGLGPALKRVEPDGSNGVRVWLENASFDSVIGWLNVMASRYGVDVDSASMERTETRGRINARLSLQAPAS
jgi:general secretion pathway protein M